MALRLNGSTSGYVELDAPAVAGITALTLPATAGTVATQAYADTAGGLQLITTQTFSAVSTVSVNNCFTATYENYQIVGTMSLSANAYVRMRLRASGSDASGNSYKKMMQGIDSVNAASNITGTATEWDFIQGWTEKNNFEITMMNPRANNPFWVARATALNTGVTQTASYFGGGGYQTSYTADGFSIFPASGTMTGTIRVYGYKNS